MSLPGAGTTRILSGGLTARATNEPKSDTSKVLPGFVASYRAFIPVRKQRSPEGGELFNSIPCEPRPQTRLFSFKGKSLEEERILPQTLVRVSTPQQCAHEMATITSLSQWLFDNSTSALLLLLIALSTCGLFALQVIAYRLYFHPLAKYPGPRLAAISRFWKAYVECFRQRSFCHELQVLHGIYGIGCLAPNRFAPFC